MTEKRIDPFGGGRNGAHLTTEKEPTCACGQEIPVDADFPNDGDKQWWHEKHDPHMTEKEEGEWVERGLALLTAENLAEDIMELFEIRLTQLGEDRLVEMLASVIASEPSIGVSIEYPLKITDHAYESHRPHEDCAMIGECHYQPGYCKAPPERHAKGRKP